MAAQNVPAASDNRSSVPKLQETHEGNLDTPLSCTPQGISKEGIL